ncbi:MAG: PHB depolymerase family esterase [Bacteroidota bacterium]
MRHPKQLNYTLLYLLTSLLFFLVISCSDDPTATPSEPMVEEPSIRGFFTRNITIGPAEREFILYVPESYDENRATPLLFNYHGYTQTADFQFNFGAMRPIADTANFILVYPQGAQFRGNTHWNIGSWTQGSTASDLSFTGAMIDAIAEDYNVDEDRVYACGYSNGGFFSFELACNLSSRIAAVGSVAGNMSERTFDSCNPSHPTPIITIHGTNDIVVRYNGTVPDGIISQDEVLSYWTNFNNTDTVAQVLDIEDIDLSDGSNVEFYQYSNGDNGSAVEHYKVINGRHDWPGSSGNMDIDASLLIWKFVSQFDINGRIR